MRPMFQGSIVALVTPFRGGKVDEPTLKKLVEMHVAQGTDGIVPCGTTGESPTLSHDEHKRVVEIVIEAARGRLHVIAGTGSNDTSEGVPAVNVETDPLVRIVKDCPNIVGVKEASGSLDQMTQVILACGPDFSVLSGDDKITLPLRAIGGRGAVSAL